MQHHIELLSTLIISFYILTTKFLCYIFSQGHAILLFRFIVWNLREVSLHHIIILPVKSIVLHCRTVVIVEEEVEAEAEAEVLGSGRPGRRAVWGGR